MNLNPPIAAIPLPSSTWTTVACFLLIAATSGHIWIGIPVRPNGLAPAAKSCTTTSSEPTRAAIKSGVPRVAETLLVVCGASRSRMSTSFKLPSAAAKCRATPSSLEAREASAPACRSSRAI